MPRATRRTRCGALLLAAALPLAVAGCGNDGNGAGSKHGTSAARISTAAQVAEGRRLASTWPMTGLPVTGHDTAAQPHPVLVLKMDNTEASAPQMGLGTADMVVEELVEGGLTRLAAFFYSRIPGDVGPVRSMRASDIGIVSPVDASVVTSGAAAVTIARITHAGIPFFQEGAKGFYRDSARSAPYNLFTNLSETETLTEGKDRRPADYLPWGSEKTFPQGVPARTLAATFSSGGHTTNWQYADGRYTNLNTYAAAGDTFPATTVLVLRVRVGDAGYLDPAGNFVPETKFTGSGGAMVFHDGRMVRATWSKAHKRSPLELATATGPLEVPAGHTWIELVPVDGGSVSYTP